MDGGQLLAVGGNREAEPMFEAEVTAALHASMEGLNVIVLVVEWAPNSEKFPLRCASV